MAVVYEWDCETVADGDCDLHEDEEVIDHCHSASYQEALRDAAKPTEPGFKHLIVLVRDDGDRRSWAYMEGDRLPEFHIDGDGRNYKAVPKRFHQEVERAHQK